MQIYTLYKKLVEKKNSCYISRKSRIGNNVIFEGNNYVGKGTFLQHCDIGFMSYFGDYCEFVNSSIGKYCSIAPGCKVIAGDHPTSEYVSTHPAFYSKNRTAGRCYVSTNKFDEFKFADKKKSMFVLIGNDVWMASDVMVLAGVSIGDGAIIAAGSLVTHDIPPYAIVGGIPAKVIRYRFSDEDIEWLLNFKWWDKEQKWVEENAELFEHLAVFKSKFDFK